MYTGKTRNLGVMGWPIAHSLSPVLQNAAIEEAGLDYAYVALPVEPLNRLMTGKPIPLSRLMAKPCSIVRPSLTVCQQSGIR